MQLRNPPYKHSRLGRVDTVVYHSNCADGFCSAAIAHQHLRDSRFVSARYGWDPHKELKMGGRTVLFVDFCPTEQVLNELIIPRWQHWYVIDHHISHGWILNYDDPDRPHVQFNQNYCAAWIAWEFFNPGEHVPSLVRYVQDRDLWIYELPWSREISAAIQMWPHDFGHWDEQLRARDMDSWIDRGRETLEIFKSIYERTAMKSVLVDFNGVKVRMVNTSTMISETCNHILTTRQDVDTVIAFFFKDPETVVLCFRARAGTECLSLGETVGAAGHPEACACSLKYDQFYKVVRPA